MKLTVRDTFETDVDTYWNAVFFDPEFNRRLYVDALGFRSFDLLELTGEPGQKRTRKMRTEPASEAPAFLRKVIGDSLSYTESGTFDPATGVWSYALVTNKVPDKVHIGGRLWAEPRGEKRCERVAEIEIAVNVFGVGGAIEKFIEKTTRESYAKAGAFTNRYIAEKGL